MVVEKGRETIVMSKGLMTSPYNNLIFQLLSCGHLPWGLGRGVFGLDYPLSTGHAEWVLPSFFSDVSFFLGTHADYPTFSDSFLLLEKQ